MAIPIKNSEEIKAMRESGKILAEVLEECIKRAKPGVSTLELDKFAEEFIIKKGGKPAFKGYHGFPCTLCTAINEIIVHGIPNQNQILKEGDLFTVDCGVIYQGMYTDAARSTGIGEISKDKNRLLKTAKKALNQAIDLAKPGVHLGKISKEIQKIIEDEGFHVIYDLTGHGVGKTLHEEPIVTNYWDGSPGEVLAEGMCIAIEPIFSTTTSKMKTLKDGWTIVTSDNSPSVQEEHTILITEKGAEILTKLRD
ncbi:type I methionyl aminopeptidase [Candidatus Peregrinibacteria bacterium]|nr:type I methionyl aminopeptidase [Candidatus Peregrinibacteria bacterium]